MSISSKLGKLTTDITSAYNAINTKGGTLPQNKNTDNLPSAINSIPTGGTPTGTINITTNGIHDVTNYATADVNVSGSSGEKDVNFYDYDGTIVNSYTKAEFLALSSMPSNPTHTGLVSQGWNWSLADAQAYVRDYGRLDIGQTYITDDGKTRIYIHLDSGRLKPYLGFAIRGTAIVNWGDNTTSTVTGNSTTSVISTQHTYANAGDYIITIDSESKIYLSGQTNGSQILWKNESNMNTNRIYNSAIRKIKLGNASIEGNAFSNCYSLASITISSGVTSIGSSAFSNCYSLASITIPSGVTSIGSSAFENCTGLTNVVIPDSVTSIGQWAFYNCTGLTNVVIPDSVTSIGSYVFYYCTGLTNVVIPDSVTRIEGNAFSNCYSLASITIPSGVTSIGSSAFSNCYSLASITISSGVTSIGSSAFYSCYGVAYYDFTSLTSVPTLASTNVFTGLASDCKIVVPDSLYSNWITATNWSTYANYIIRESDYNAS